MHGGSAPRKLDIGTQWKSTLGHRRLYILGNNSHNLLDLLQGGSQGQSTSDGEE
jgi:hypothetical protein